MQSDGITLVFLTKGKVALIDSADAERVLPFKWYPCGRRYACRTGPKLSASRYALIYMHREIMEAPDGIEADHRNRCGTDNRRCNLRVANRSQNAMNRGRRSDNTSGYRGVSWSKRGHWVASICIRGRQKWLGSFATAEDAARAYDSAAGNEFGEFANLNFSGH
jgi:hypothetical protein